MCFDSVSTSHAHSMTIVSDDQHETRMRRDGVVDFGVGAIGLTGMEGVGQ